MKQYHLAYEQFVKWVQQDITKARVAVNRKVFSVVLWCLVIPAVLSMVMYGLRRYQVIPILRYADNILFLPPFFFSLYSLWPTLRDLPRVFKMGGLSAILQESSREVLWREQTSYRLQQEVKLSPREWSLIAFHLEQDIKRLNAQNRYMTILSSVVLFFMVQFLELGGSGESIREPGALGLLASWVDQFSQWGAQVFSILLFSVLFYLSGIQLQKHLVRYEVCVKRLGRNFEESDL